MMRIAVFSIGFTLGVISFLEIGFKTRPDLQLNDILDYAIMIGIVVGVLACYVFRSFINRANEYRRQLKINKELERERLRKQIDVRENDQNALSDDDYEYEDDDEYKDDDEEDEYFGDIEFDGGYEYDYEDDDYVYFKRKKKKSDITIVVPNPHHYPNLFG